jgi:hypothetical protein
MRYQDQQYDDTHPEVVKSDPVPVPPPDGDEPAAEDLARDRREETAYDSQTDDDRLADEALVDRGTFDDPITAGERPEAERGDDGVPAMRDAGAVDEIPDDSGFGQADADRDRADEDRDGTGTGPVGAEADPEADDRIEPMPVTGHDGGFGSTGATRDVDVDRTEAVSDTDLDRSGYDRDHVTEPAPQSTTFGAATVGGAAAAAAMAGQGRAEPHDLRDEDTARRGDGTVDDQLAYADTTPADRYPDTVEHPDRADVSGVGTADVGTADVGTADVGTADVGAPTTSTDTVDGQPVGEVAPAGQLMPGDVPAEPVAALLSAETGQTFRDRWREVQLRFVDDPRAAATDAQRLVEEAIESLARALAEQKESLADWGSGGGGDTENLRVAVRRYRDFLDRLLGL